MNDSMILRQILSGRQYSRFVLIKENNQHSGHHLVRRLISDNLSRKIIVHIFTYQHVDATPFVDLYGKGSLTFHPCFTNPWNLDTITTNGPDKSWIPHILAEEGEFLIIIDSISYSMLNLDIHSVCTRLLELRGLNTGQRRVQVVGVVNMNVTLEDSVEFHEINRIADTVLTLGDLPNANIKVSHRKPLGKILESSYLVKLDNNNKFDFVEATEKTVLAEPPKEESTPQVLTTFKLSLDDKEKESRSQVVLPYVKTAKTSGQIIYEPDENDDWDDEDPDDDLEI